MLLRSCHGVAQDPRRLGRGPVGKLPTVKSSLSRRLCRSVPPGIFPGRAHERLFTTSASVATPATPIEAEPGSSDRRPIVFITGCSAGGIGHALALELCAQGCTVYATARRPDAVGAMPAGVHVMELEVTDPKSIAAAVDAIVAEQGRIDILVNNAGMGCYGPIAEIDIATAKRVYEVNVFGMMAVTQAVVPTMAAQRSGKIVNIGSIVGYIGTPFGGVYSSTKAAVHNMSDAMRLELAPFGIQVLLVAPGAIKSNFGSNSAARLDTSYLRVYKDYAKSIEERSMASQTGKSTPADVFAKRVVDQILKKDTPRHFMFGYLSNLFKVMMILPGWVPDWFLAKRFGLDRPAPSNTKIE